MQRRRFLSLMGTSLLWPVAAQSVAAQPVEFPLVKPRMLVFPRDHGAHPTYRTEWWYITGWLNEARGFQLTFFRNRPGIAEDSTSAFAPKQLLFAHAAISDPGRGRLLHDQRTARAGFDLAGALEDDTRVWIDDWRLERTDAGYRTHIAATDFAFDFEFRTTQPLLLQGDEGYSRKGPRPQEASHYYSRPQLEVSGALLLKGKREAVQGRAWLDHEWSSEYLSKDAIGWDWTGLNFDDGAALMAFRIRAKDGSTYWTGGTFRDASGQRETYAADQIRFEVLRQWRSPRTDTIYPVAMRLHIGPHIIELEPLMDDQELDSRASTGTIYWEGAVRALRNGKSVGRGYLELTGYWQRVRM
jgi:predicted secreted hydrolase